ncbi:hypothetical protein G7046_g7720 [Stylonectria norvegica]|nr:hypothetical protein G7046_g7720 [Stylonectria norvegica]
MNSPWREDTYLLPYHRRNSLLINAGVTELPCVARGEVEGKRNESRVSMKGISADEKNTAATFPVLVCKER